jgi:hypothetical protein
MFKKCLKKTSAKSSVGFGAWKTPQLSSLLNVVYFLNVSSSVMHKCSIEITNTVHLAVIKGQMLWIYWVMRMMSPDVQ